MAILVKEEAHPIHPAPAALGLVLHRLPHLLCVMAHLQCPSLRCSPWMLGSVMQELEQPGSAANFAVCPIYVAEPVDDCLPLGV